MDVLYEKPGHITVSHNPRINYVLFRWANYYVTMEEIQTLHRAALDHARTRACYHYIADTSNVTNALPQDVVQWWGQEWVPGLAKYGLKAIFTIVPTAALAKSSTKRWQGHVQVQGIELIDVRSLLDAETQIRSWGKNSA